MVTRGCAALYLGLHPGAPPEHGGDWSRRLHAHTCGRLGEGADWPFSVFSCQL